MRRVAALLAVLATFAATATAEAKQLVRYNVGGGLAGLSDQLIVARDATARQSGNRRGDAHRFMLSAKQMRALRRDLKRARFSTLKRSYHPKYVVNDGIAQSVTYKGRSVSVSTGAEYPARLGRLLRRLGQLMRRPSAAAAHADPKITNMQMRLTGHNPGPGYYVRVRIRLRVCAVRGPARVVLGETLRIGGDVFSTHRRGRHFDQTAACQRRTFKWRLAEKFFGVGTYRVAATVTDKDAQVSNTVSRRQTNND
jgi:hypothetical protein